MHYSVDLFLILFVFLFVFLGFIGTFFGVKIPFLKKHSFFALVVSICLLFFSTHIIVTKKMFPNTNKFDFTSFYTIVLDVIAFPSYKESAKNSQSENELPSNMIISVIIYPPFTYGTEESGINGLEVEIIKKIATTMNITPVFHIIKNVELRETVAVQSSDVVIGGFSSNTILPSLINYGITYYQSPFEMISIDKMSENSINANNISKLSNHSIGFSLGNDFDYYNSIFSNKDIKISSYTDGIMQIDDLISRNINYGIIDKLMFKYYKLFYPENDFFETPLSLDDHGIRKNHYMFLLITSNKLLKSEFRKALFHLSNKQISNIMYNLSIVTK